MTARQVWQAVLVELNKVQAPNILLEDFNYFFNKAINQFVNKQYNNDGINQQNLDNSRVLRGSTILFPIYDGTKNGIVNNVVSWNASENTKFNFILPADYLHLLGCTAWIFIAKDTDCCNKGSFIKRGVKRLNEDIDPLITENWWMRPDIRRPYYYIHNENLQNMLPTNKLGNETISFMHIDPSTCQYTNIFDDPDKKVYNNTSFNKLGTDITGNPSDSINNTILEKARNGENIRIAKDQGFPHTLTIEGAEQDDVVQRTAGHRYGNASAPILTIVYGKDSSVYKLDHINLAYLKSPQHIRLTQEQIDLTEDTSQIMEFPDYVCQEIINELVTIIMENSGDQVLTARMANHKAVSESIANPAQQQAQPNSK